MVFKFSRDFHFDYPAQLGLYTSLPLLEPSKTIFFFLLIPLLPVLYKGGHSALSQANTFFCRITTKPFASDTNPRIERLRKNPALNFPRIIIRIELETSSEGPSITRVVCGACTVGAPCFSPTRLRRGPLGFPTAPRRRFLFQPVPETPGSDAGSYTDSH